MSKLDDAIKKVQKDFGVFVIGKLEETQKEYKKVYCGTPSMTYLFRGGMPRTIIELIGEQSAGKSTYSYCLCANAQRTLKEEYEEEVAALQEIAKPKAEQKERLQYLLDRGYQKVVYLDHEFTSDPEWMEKNGVDVDELIYIRPDGQTAEQLFQILLDLIESDGVGCVVLDSIPALVSGQAMSKDMTEKTMAGISAPLSSFCAKMMIVQKKHNVLFIFINQPRDDMQGYHRLITPGGRFLKHTCSIRLLFKKGGYYDDKYADLKAHPEEATGNYTEVEVIKNKATKPDRKMCKFSITYEKGIDATNDYFNMAIALGVIKKAGAWFSYNNEEGNPIEAEDGTLCKWQGARNTIEYLDTHADIFNVIKNQVDELIIQD